MRVLWVELISELGGAQHSLLETCAALPSVGVDVAVAVPYGPLFDRLTAAGLAVFPVAPERAKKRGWRLFTSPDQLRRAPNTVFQIIRAVKPDIIHANSLQALLASRHAFSPIPIIWHARDVRMPVLIARRASKDALRILASSDAVYEYLVHILSPGILSRVHVICDGIDPARFTPGDKSAARQRFGLPSGGPVIGMIAHVVPWKRHDDFILTAAEIRKVRPDAHFVIVGRDLLNGHAGLVSKLKNQVAQAGLGEVLHWITTCDSSNEILPAFDLLLHPAQREPFGRVICEAMAASVPVIASESGGPASIIQHRVSGILVRDGDPQLMAEEALALLFSPGHAATLGAVGHDRVMKLFTMRQVCEQLAKEYAALISAASARHDNDG